MTTGRIRDRDESPGLRECEASVVRLVDKITNGSRVEINETGTRITFVPGKEEKPGILLGILLASVTPNSVSTSSDSKGHVGRSLPMICTLS